MNLLYLFRAQVLMIYGSCYINTFAKRKYFFYLNLYDRKLFHVFLMVIILDALNKYESV